MRNHTSRRLQDMALADRAGTVSARHPHPVTDSGQNTETASQEITEGGHRWLAVVTHPAIAALLLLVVYAGLSFANDPDGFLGTDTGGKVATLQAMEARGSVGGLDVGYWAEAWDPDGDLHGFWSTKQVDGERWVQVSTVPLTLGARPLWEVGGYRLALLLPMLGGVACALAARALCRRIGGSRADETTAFWLVGLAGPVLIYSLDLWEHTLGLAAMAWATVLMADAVEDGAGLRRTAGLAASAGLLWGVGFSMRTEALLYGAVVTAVLCSAIVRRRPRAAVVAGASTAIGLGIGVLGNSALERTVLRGVLRAGRASGTAKGFGAEAGTRIREGIITTFGINGTDVGILFGVVAVVAAAVLIRRSSRTAWAQDRYAAVLVTLVVVPVLLLLAREGPGFVPGMLVAAPVAIAGLALAPVADRRGGRLVLAVVVALPLVWAFQFLGGASPQWGGRYVMLTALVLTVAGTVSLRLVDPVVRALVIGAAVVITAFGFSWMVARTHGFAGAGERIAAVDEPVIIARDSAGFLPREFVATNPDQRWLATLGDEELERAVQIVDEAGFDGFGVLVFAGQVTPERLGDMERVEVVSIPVVSGATIEVVRYER